MRILYQQNNTWQGEVLWAEQNQKQYFRSALELLSLMDSAVKVAVTNNSTAPLYNAYITDTMDPGLTMNEGVDSEGDNSGAEGAKCVYAGYNGTTVRKGLECKVYKWNLPDAASEKLPTEPSHKKGDEVTVDAEYAKG